MNIGEFVSSVLVQIHNGIKSAEAEADKEYYILTSNDKRGVYFDIAVTTTTMNSSKIEGEISADAKANLIQVVSAKLDAKVTGNSSQETENSEISRVQFTVYVPPRSKKEEEAYKPGVTYVTGHSDEFDPY